MKPFEIPLSLTVLTPEKATQRTGIQATTHVDSRIIYARLNKFEVVDVKKVCEILNIAEGTFVRHATVNVAEAVLREYKQWKDEYDFREWQKQKDKEKRDEPADQSDTS